MDCARPLLRADIMCMTLPAISGWWLSHGAVDAEDAAISSQDHRHETDIWQRGTARPDRDAAGRLLRNWRRTTRGLEVCNYDMLMTRSEQHRSESWNDWILPYRTCTPLGLSISLEGSPGPASLMSYRRLPTTRPFGDRELEILRMLQPSFETAVNALQQFDRTRNELIAYVDRLRLATLVVGQSGAVHANEAFRSALGQDAREIARVVVPCAQRLLRSDRYSHVPEMGGTISDPLGRRVPWSVHVWASAASTPLALVHFYLRTSFQIAREALAAFRLTPRQVQVAYLMAERHSYKEIATQLRIKPNTARRHCEQVLTSLGVHSRHELRQSLLTKIDVPE